MPKRKPLLPIHGATNGTSFRGTPEGMCPWQAIRNVRVFGVDSDRPRMSRRPCLEQMVYLKDAPVQGVIPVSLSSTTTGYQLGSCSALTGAVTTPAGLLVGQIAALDDAASMDWFAYLNVTGSGGPADNSVQACAWDPDGEFLAVASNYAVGGFNRFTVARVNPDTGAFVWVVNSSEAGKNRSVNDILVTKLYTFVAIANNGTASGGPKLIAYRNDTGAVALNHNLGGWANEGVCLALYTDSDGAEHLFVAFHGAATAGTYTGGSGSGVIQYGRWALQFRSGIMKFAVDGSAYGGSVLTREDFGTALASDGDFYEAAHHSWRFSEQTFYRPHGCEFTALACDTSGNVYFAKRNQGWGPNDSADWRPNGITEPYTTVGKISAAGVLLWLADTDSIRENDDLGYPNDLTYPGDATPEPSVNALAVTPDGTAVCGGRRNANGKSAFGVSTDGVRTWDATLAASGDAIREGCAALDQDGAVWLGGDRGTGWTGASGANAFLWKLDPATGDILDHLDLNESVSCLGVACAGDGRVFLTTDKIV